MISATNYDYKNWKEYFPKEINISSLFPRLDKSWREFFEQMYSSGMFVNVERALKEECYAELASGEKNEIFPYPQLMLFPFERISIDEIKIVIIGQDPYFNARYNSNRMIPEAMGVSFSVPIGTPIPPTLQNIYKNQLKYKNIFSMPTHGNLQSWVAQGCLMMNTSFTVKQGEPNSHKFYWKTITDKLLKYISDNTKNIIFVLWGGDAYDKIKLIDVMKHDTIISSHPSGRSCTTPLKSYPAFDNFDHFGTINDILKKSNKSPIVWQL